MSMKNVKFIGHGLLLAARLLPLELLAEFRVLLPESLHLGLRLTPIPHYLLAHILVLLEEVLLAQLLPVPDVHLTDLVHLKNIISHQYQLPSTVP